MTMRNKSGKRTLANTESQYYRHLPWITSTSRKHSTNSIPIRGRKSRKMLALTDNNSLLTPSSPTISVLMILTSRSTRQGSQSSNTSQKMISKRLIGH